MRPEPPRATGKNPFLGCCCLSRCLSLRTSLRAYGRDIQTIGGALVFRGFRPGESMESFSQRIQKTFPKPVPLLLDPLLFRKFNVTDVPTFVLTEASTSDQVSGHLTLESFLEVIAQEGELADLALHLKETLSP